MFSGYVILLLIWSYATGLLLRRTMFRCHGQHKILLIRSVRIYSSTLGCGDTRLSPFVYLDPRHLRETECEYDKFTEIGRMR